MLFMTYKPKAAKNVKAEQITEKTIGEIAASFNGSAKVIPANEHGVAFLKIATFDSPLTASIGDWVVRTEEGVEIWGDLEFNEKYERARNVRDN